MSPPLRQATTLAGTSLLLGAAVLGCGNDGATGTSSSGAGGGPSSLPPPICDPMAKPWTQGTRIFNEATASSQLGQIGALGVRLATVDFDGDGFPDLIVRKGGATPDDFSPGGARQTWLLRNTRDGHFEDVTISSGFRKNRTEPDPNKGRPGEVVAFADIDNDGDLDAYTGLSSDPMKPQTETSELLINQGDGTFALGPEGSPVRVKAPTYDVPAGASFVDFDRDGAVDLWVAQSSVAGAPQQDRLYKGDGKGGFVDVTFAMGLKTKPWVSIADLNTALAHSNAWSAAACDLNGDGNAELLATSYGRAPNHLWQSKGPGAGFLFENRSVASGYAFDDTADWHDNESARCWCTLHPMDMGCAGVPPPMSIPCVTDADAFRWNNATDQEPFRLGGNSGATLCADVNNDGQIDLVTSEIVHWDVGSSSDPAELLVNTGEPDARFTRPGNAVTGLTRTHIPGWNEGIITGSVFDFDNDGWADIYWGNTDYPGNYGLLYHQDAKGQFSAVPLDQGIDHHRSHGSAVADFDRDGDLDIVVGHSFARCNAECYPTQQIRFFENTLGGNFIELTLTGGPSANRAAIGARVTVKTGDITQTREVGGGHGHYGAQDDLTVHVGLGAACEAEITVRWPDAELTTQTFTLPAGYRFTLTQGEAPKAAPKQASN